MPINERAVKGGGRKHAGKENNGLWIVSVDQPSDRHDALAVVAAKSITASRSDANANGIGRGSRAPRS